MFQNITLGAPLALPCGAVLPNRLCKAAMTEGLADPMNRPGDDLERLYRTWSEGGAGLLLTGNVQIDRSHLERPGNMVIDGNGGEDAFRRLAQAGRTAGNHIWMQINHPGRQTERRINPHPSAPSSVPLTSPGDYGRPRALSEREILDIINRFARVAGAAREAGFTGVEIHAAHGYLLSQFLSPIANRREDDWGGSLANRARLLLEVVKSARAAVGDDFPIGVKLNSSDFQKGGFEMHESVQVAQWLNQAGIDLLELSGGNYERTSMTGVDTPESTMRREAHFLDFAHSLRPVISTPVMVTGGFRTRKAMMAALQSGDTDMIGIGGPLCLEPDLPAKLLAGATEAAWMSPARLMDIHKDKALSMDQASPARSGAYLFFQIMNIARTGAPDLTVRYNDVVDEMVATEDETYERLENFPPHA